MQDRSLAAAVRDLTSPKLLSKRWRESSASRVIVTHKDSGSTLVGLQWAPDAQRPIDGVLLLEARELDHYDVVEPLLQHRKQVVIRMINRLRGQTDRPDVDKGDCSIWPLMQSQD